MHSCRSATASRRLKEFMPSLRRLFYKRKRKKDLDNELEKCQCNERETMNLIEQNIAATKIMIRNCSDLTSRMKDFRKWIRDEMCIFLIPFFYWTEKILYLWYKVVTKQIKRNWHFSSAITFKWLSSYFFDPIHPASKKRKNNQWLRELCDLLTSRGQAGHPPGLVYRKPRKEELYMFLFSGFFHARTRM